MSAVKNNAGFFDLCFKFADRQAAGAALLAAGFDADNQHPSAQVDFVGVVSKPTGEVVNVGGIETPQFAPVAGYHVNVRTWDDALAARLADLPEVITPATPLRVWL
ncbi:MAG: hypothetical protein ACRCVR_06105 [Plesiomonas shigelloides]